MAERTDRSALRSAVARFWFVVRRPEGTVLRRSLRIAIAVPIVLAVALAVGARDEAGFAVFATVSALGLADFGGPRQRRLVAFVGLAIVGAVYVALGTLCSQTLVAAIVGVVVVTFVTRMAGVLGGHPAAGNVAALLAFVLAVMDPGDLRSIPGREAGWIAGGLFAAAVALLLWPRDEKRLLAELAAKASRAMATVIRRRMSSTLPDGAGADELQAVRELRGQLLDTPYRPAGPGRRDRLILQTIELLERAFGFASTVTAATPEVDEERSLADRTTAALDATAALLEGGPRTAVAGVDTEGLEAARSAYRQALERWTRHHLDGAGATPEADAVLDQVDRALPLGALAVIADELGVMADDALVEPPLPPGRLVRVRLGQGRAWLRRCSRIIASHLRWSSAWFRSAARGALALGASVAVARWLGVHHAFWIVLGTLSVLRSNAASTGSTALQAVGGTALGFAVASAFVIPTHDSAVALWIVLPIVAFLSMWLPGRYGLVGGQAGFALLVVVLFNILAPAGWETGLDRLENVGIGAAVSMAAALLFWPRGAHAVLRGAVSAWYRSASVYATGTIDVVRGEGPIEPLDSLRAHAEDCGRRAEVALEEYLNERGTKTEPWTPWGPVMRVPAAVVFATAAVARSTAERSPVGGACPAALDELEAGARAVASSLEATAEALERPIADGHLDLVPPPPPRVGLRHCLVSSADDPARFHDAFTLTWVSEWLGYLAAGITRYEAELEAAEAPTARTSRR